MSLQATSELFPGNTCIASSCPSLEEACLPCLPVGQRLPSGLQDLSLERMHSAQMWDAVASCSRLTSLDGAGVLPSPGWVQQHLPRLSRLQWSVIAHSEETRLCEVLQALPHLDIPFLGFSFLPATFMAMEAVGLRIHKLDIAGGACLDLSLPLWPAGLQVSCLILCVKACGRGDFQAPAGCITLRLNLDSCPHSIVLRRSLLPSVQRVLITCKKGPLPVHLEGFNSCKTSLHYSVGRSTFTFEAEVQG